MAKPEKYLIDALRKLGGDAYVTHPDATLTVRKVERVFRVARGATEPDYLSVDTSQEALYADCQLVDQHIVGGDHQWVEVYQAWQTLPGAVVASTRLNERGALETISTQIVTTGTAAADGGVLTNSASVQAGNGVLATKTTATVTNHGTLTGKTYSRDRAFGARTVTLDTIQAPGAALPALNATTALDCVDVPIDQYKVSRRLTSLETDSQPIIYEFTFDERLGFLLATEKQIVVARTTAPTQAAGTTVEYHPIDKWIGVLITSRTGKSQADLDALARSYPVTIEHRFPNLLTAATWEYQRALGDDGTIGIDVSLTSKITAGYGGPCDGLVYEYFTYSPAVTLAQIILDADDTIQGEIYKIWEEAYTTNAGWVIEGSQTVAHVQTFSIPPTIHDAITIGLNGNLNDAIPAPTLADDFPGFATTIPATTPTLTQFLAKPYILKSIDTFLYKIGIYILRLTVVANPHYVP